MLPICRIFLNLFGVRFWEADDLLLLSYSIANDGNPK
jgi:hypothetical protein